MLLQPPVLALLFASTLQALAVLAAVPFSQSIARRWDLRVAGERQLELERRTHLVSTLIALVMGLQLFTLPVFVFTADRLAVQLSGAMCAVGTLNADPHGFPALALRIASFFAAVGWLALDDLDGRAPSYPLARLKYALVLGLAPLFLAAAVLDWQYFAGLVPDELTSCCARVFAPAERSLSGDLAALAPRPAAALFFGALGLAAGASAFAAARPRSARVSAVAGLAGVGAFPAVVAGVVSFVAPAAYDEALHHCPFCILKSEYGHLGYALYGPLFVAASASVWLLGAALASRVESLRPLLPPPRRRRAALAAAGYAVIAVVAGLTLARSHLALFP
ncbi:MAG: hypothetical protein U0599_02680 [Vicinamibacteria bacterium]